MSHQEICAVLDLALDIAWWLFFPTVLVALVFCFAALFSGPRQ
jgi:hypothetical protein